MEMVRETVVQFFIGHSAMQVVLKTANFVAAGLPVC
jgi:hypothetical protein